LNDFDENFGEATFDSLARMFSQAATFKDIDRELNLTPREVGPEMQLIDELEPDEMSLDSELGENGMHQKQQSNQDDDADEMF